MRLGRVYERLGTRYLEVLPVLGFISALPITLLLVGLGAPYFGASAEELAGLFAVDLAGFLGAAALGARRWRPHGRRIAAWIEEGRDPATAAALWDETVRLRHRIPMRAFLDAVVLVGSAGSVYLAAVIGLDALDAAIAFGSFVVIALYSALLLYFGLELYLRPLLRDLGARVPYGRDAGTRRAPFAFKLFAALLLVGGSAGLNLAWLQGLSDPSLERLAVGIGLALVVTLTATLEFTLLFTGSLYAPVGDLIAATRQIREGDLSARVPPISDDELGQLGRNFNEMAAELARSREELVSAREEERRRLRRDLHDELGPSLAAVAMRIEAAAALVDRDPQAARAMLGELRAEVGEAVADIRRVVYELRPPQLDELGLLGAIEERAARLSGRDGDGVTIRVEAPERLDPLPAAVEVAAFRIVHEALLNAARHAEARSCTVTVAANGALELEVRDDGVGISRNGSGGVGLASMRERAAELGGTCTVERADGGGTLVRARLPLP